VHQVALKP